MYCSPAIKSVRFIFGPTHIMSLTIEELGSR